MKMVPCAPGRYEGKVLPAGDPGQVLPQSLRVADEVGAIFRAEDAMHEVAGQGVRHVLTLPSYVVVGGDDRHTSLCGARIEDRMDSFSDEKSAVPEALRFS